MNYFRFLIAESFFDFSRNKGRTFLTSLGILIGVMAVVLMLALGLGLKKYISDQLDSLGANLIYILPGNKKALVSGGGMIGGLKFDDKDVFRVKRVRNIEAVAPVFSKPGVEIEANGKAEIVELLASYDEINSIMNLKVDVGRLLEHRDGEKKSKYIVISPRIAEKLFGNKGFAVGKNAEIEGQSFKIIGVYQSKGGGGLGGGDMDSHVFVSAPSIYAFNPDKKYYGIYIKASSKLVIDVVKRDLQNVLVKRYDEKKFTVIDQSEIMSTITQIFNVLNLVLVAISAISLVVGGVGIMNIMYVSVSERTKEIGIRRSLGALKKDILYHFLCESILLSLIGGLSGILLSAIVVYFVQPLFPAYLDLRSILLALGVSSCIGVVFGVFPAKRAADLSPIDAIRYE